MRSFKKIWWLPIVIFLVAAVNAGLNYALIPYSYVRIMMHDVRTRNYDTVVFGTSHGLSGISPKVIEEETGEQTANLCMGGEYPRDAYYLLQLVCEKKTPKTVIYEMDFGYWCTPENQRGDFNRIYYEMPFSKTKLKYFLHKETKLDFRAALFPWFYYRSQLWNMKSIIEGKQGDDYKNYGAAVFQSERQRYEDGFMKISPVPGEKPECLVPWDESEKNEDSFQYFEKIVSFCEAQGIRLVVVTTPVPREALEKYEREFQKADEFFTEYLEEQGVEYWNYNRSELQIDNFDDSLNAFTDYEGHMSAEQAEIFSVQMAEDIL